MRDAASITVHDLIEAGYEVVASDIMLKAGSEPRMKQHSHVGAVPGEWPVLSEADVDRLIFSVMSEKQKLKFENSNELDLSFVVEEIGRAHV